MTDAHRHRVALVTGGARRIGRAIVEDLAAHGWAVAIHCHNSRDEAESLATAIRSGRGHAVVVQGDLLEVANLKGVVTAARSALGPLTLLVNNASIFERDTVGGLDLALYERQLAVNLTAPVFLAEAFATQVPQGVEGSVINVLDQRIWRPTPSHFSYQISKSALATATLVLAQALAPRVRVNGIAPGSTIPNIKEDPDEFRRGLERLPLGHGPDLAEFGRTVRYLVETRSITGQVIGLDGGQHLAWRRRESAIASDAN
jgi:NAD(P)-dependent dehydrogenase (short-subunit alcohol dehydrogenase family)